MINIIIILTINCPTYFLKRFYNRETIAASNYEIQQMSFIPPPHSGINSPKLDIKREA
jgi:hypothetical protein